ncbi:BlaI/MecI/CopY family transcriptional regulator [Streptomyces sp. AS02]|uniref:BlaI/MecI/CopY family transcriptional regulator n=1 Tax=Streptomyces sp. AS02 TaxID=2938946 RepID=UPI002020FF40|nr:BlaI/MecI/CopY family transcriptional regulator [Streptomyces sp. AS02]MCL8015916.1 BlaI/MecI/CopY family transcriptional regulator [Streptomyces sp. AS02]
MSETTSVTTELTSQYSAQVAGDLESNLKEQERVNGEIEALQAQLAALQQDHTVLVNIQLALGVPAAPATPAVETVAAVPAPRTRTPRAAKQTKDKKPGAAARKRTGSKSATKTATASSTSPTLVALVREHLAGQSEPRSAAEVATALGQQHPERTVKATVVRTTLEGLVAKNQAQRSKQGTSVFYTADASEPAAPAQESPQQSD